VLPIYFFVRAIDESADNQRRLTSIVGICFVLAFMIFGLSQNWLSRSSISAFYVTILVAFLSTSRSSLASQKI
jgi:hypothetical protein